MRGAEFRARRESCGLSQSALAARAGVCRATVNRWETEVWPVPPEGWAALERVEEQVAADADEIVLAAREWSGSRPLTVAYAPGRDCPENAAARLARQLLKMEGVPVTIEYSA
jgi:transcriptional regulator with XRE-family HTH domain